MTPRSLAVSRFVLVLLPLASPMLVAAQPILAYGVTNVAIGNAELSVYTDGGTYTVNSLGSNGLDGVSVHLGEPDTGAFFSPTTGYLQDGNYMIAKPYGRLNGTNDSLLAILRGGRASPQVYPLRLDYSPLAPQSVTYQVFFNGVLTHEFTQGAPMVTVNYGAYTYPTFNPLMRRADGALGTELRMSQPVTFVFPDLLSSAYGDLLFVRLNNPANVPGPVSRVDIFGGGRLYDFSFNDIALGVFGRPHQALSGVSLEARSNWLRIDNFVNTNYLPGVLIKTEPVGALNLQCEPFQLAESNALLLVTGIGTAGGQPYTGLGTLRLAHGDDGISITVEDVLLGDFVVQVLTNGGISHSSAFVNPFTVSIPTNAPIGSITAHAKTLENLPGYHLQFTETIPVTLRSNLVVSGNELRLVMPAPVRMEHLNNVFVSGMGFGALTVTNEITTDPAGAARLQIARAVNSVVLKWPDPNRLFGIGYADYDVYGPYWGVTNEIIFNDPYKTVTIPIVPTNKFTFFRLHYQPNN